MRDVFLMLVSRDRALLSKTSIQITVLILTNLSTPNRILAMP
jgi:hypothetical protein